MFEKIRNLLKYNNAVPIIFTILFGGLSVSFAASPNIRGAVYSSQSQITSIDNRAIVSADLDNYVFGLQIKSVTEDNENYYVTYDYTTLSLSDGVWGNVSEEKVFKANRESLGDKDLGLYVARQLADNINYERSYLKRAQDIEKGKGVSQKVVTTEYAGLVGKFINPTEKVVEGYTPVIPELPEVIVVPESAATSSGQTASPSIVVPDSGSHAIAQPVIQQSSLDEEAVKRIVEEMLAQYQQQNQLQTSPTPTPTPSPQPVPQPTPTPTPTPTPAPAPEPEPTIDTTTTDNTTTPEPPPPPTPIVDTTTTTNSTPPPTPPSNPAPTTP